jgi:hypothetical protein
MKSAKVNTLRKADPIEAFRARCEARAMLVDVGMLDLREAVDRLQHDAERDGLIERIGQDRIQQILSDVFRSYREAPR